MTVFLSHSRKDEAFVSLVRQALHVLGQPFHGIIYEELPPPQRTAPHWQNIDKLIRDCQAVFLVHTSNVEATEHTKAWVHHEDAVASSVRKPLVVFQLAGLRPTMPLTYWTDVAVVDPDHPQDLLKIQSVAKAHIGQALIPNPLGRALAGGAVGAVAGPLGALIGSFLGLVTTPGDPFQATAKVPCPKCALTIRYWGAPGTTFHCPHCLTPLQGGKA